MPYIMFKNLLFFIFFLFCFSVLTAQKKYAENAIIVKFTDQSAVIHNPKNQETIFKNEQINALNSQYNLATVKPVHSQSNSLIYRLEFSSNIDVQTLAKQYKETGQFKYVEPDYIGKGAGQKFYMPDNSPNDIYFGRQWSLYNDGSFGANMGDPGGIPTVAGADINMLEAWEIETGNPDIIVAVLDTGVNYDHPEFSNRIWKDEEGNIGWNFADNNSDAFDDNGHGTNVAGIALAKGNNSIGYAGMDWNAQLMICKVLDADSYGYYSWWEEAIYYAADHGARVINMSLGGTSYSQSLQDAVDYAHNKGVVLVASMMNDNTSQPGYPAAYENVIAVGSTDPNDNRTAPFFWDPFSGSNYGEHIDVVAPGNYIYGLYNENNNEYGYYYGGTSQAAPHVTGLASLLLAQNSDRSPEDIREIIRSTADDQVGDSTEDTEGFDIYYGYGRINAYRALNFENDLSTAQTEDKTIKIFPNPAKDMVNINTNTPIIKIEIIDLNGKTVFSESYAKPVSAFNVSHLETGLYFVQFNSGLYNTKLMVK